MIRLSTTFKAKRASLDQGWPREALSVVQAPKREILGSGWSTSYRSPKEGDGGLGRRCPPGETTSLTCGFLSVKSFLGERRSGKAWSQALSVWVPNKTEQLRICSQDQKPDNDPLQT